MSTQTTDCQTHNGDSNTSQDAYFGHILSEVQPGTFRVATINVNNLSTFSNDAKDLAFSSDIQRCELDIVLVQEIGVNWSKLDRRNQFHERMKDHFEQGTMRAKLSFNSHDKSGSAKQWGGTGVISHGKLSHYTMAAGADTSGLGRWTWVRYWGKNNVSLRVVSIYQPSENTNGIVSVPAQHKAYLQSKDDDRPPRTAFKEDLSAELLQRHSTGDHIIVGGDVNESIFHQSISSIFQEVDMLRHYFGWLFSKD